MEFTKEWIDEMGVRCIVNLPITIDYDLQKEGYIIKFWDDKGKHFPIGFIDIHTGETTWFAESTDNIRENSEVISALEQFREVTLFVKGDVQKIQIWLKEKLSEYCNMGFRHEFQIRVAGEGLDPENTWWVIKRQIAFSFGSEREEHPIFITRYEKGEKFQEYEMYGEPGRPFDIYIQHDGSYLPEIFAEKMTLDILGVCKNPLAISIQYVSRFY